MQILYVWPALTSRFDPHQISLETERLGPRRVESLRKEDEEWQKKASAAVLSIQDLTVKFFETTTRGQKGKCSNVGARPLNLCTACLLHYKVQLTLHAGMISNQYSPCLRSPYPAFHTTNPPPFLQRYFNPQNISAMNSCETCQLIPGFLFRLHWPESKPWCTFLTRCFAVHFRIYVDY